MNKRSKLRTLTELALLTAAALIIFTVELRFPDIIPIPGVKLGLANVITVYVLYKYSCSETVLVTLSRVLLGAFFASNFSALLYSLAGAFFCLLGMLPLKKIIPMRYMWLCSIIGAVLHNTGQIVMAMLVMRSTAVVFYYPVLIISGTIAGAFTGFCTQFTIKRLSRSSKRGN